MNSKKYYKEVCFEEMKSERIEDILVSKWKRSFTLENLIRGKPLYNICILNIRIERNEFAIILIINGMNNDEYTKNNLILK